MCEYSPGVPYIGVAECQWGSRKRRCSDISFEISDSKSRIIEQLYTVVRRLFSDTKMRGLE